MLVVCVMVGGFLFCCLGGVGFGWWLCWFSLGTCVVGLLIWAALRWFWFSVSLVIWCLWWLVWFVGGC